MHNILRLIDDASIRADVRKSQQDYFKNRNAIHIAMAKRVLIIDTITQII